VIFYLGSHQPHWLWLTDKPLFVSYSTLSRRKTMQTPTCRWALDSGGFTELNKYGRWSFYAEEYAAGVRRIIEMAGMQGPDFVAIQDWMCEPFVLEKTGLSIKQHQFLTCMSLIELREIAPEIPWMPVLQGWGFQSYIDHAEIYRRFGFDLTQEFVVGVGSVCRRHDTQIAEDVLLALASEGIRCHGFGFKSNGLLRSHQNLASADSMAWSFTARREKIKLPECSHTTCTNCMKFALLWRERLLARITRNAANHFGFMGLGANGLGDECPICGESEVSMPSYGEPDIVCSGCGHGWIGIEQGAR
jgi:hypothetical protein